MTSVDYDSERPQWDLGEIIFVLLKHKGKLLLCAAAGLIAAATVYYSQNLVYESHAKLLVRYVVERNVIDTIDAQVGTSGAGRYSDSIINAELEILTSWDLAKEVAEALGPSRVLPGTPQATAIAAAHVIRQGLTARAQKGSNVIWVSYKNPDPELAALILERLVALYFDKHLVIHRSVGAFSFVERQTQEIRGRLSQTEEELKRQKARAKIISLEEATASINSGLAKRQEELYAVEVRLAEQQARVKEIEDQMARRHGEQAAVSSAPASMGDVQQYRVLTDRLNALRQEGLDLLSKYRSENRLVKLNQEQVARLDAQRQAMEARFPELTQSVSTTEPDLRVERAELAVLEARRKTLAAQLRHIQLLAEELAEVGPQIAELERRKEVEEANYKYFEASLEKARVDEALDPSKIPNISLVQTPTPASPVIDASLNKVLIGLAGGGVAFGLGLVFVFGFLLDRTVKRPSELETKLGIPYLLSVPFFLGGSGPRLLSGKAQKKLPAGREGSDRPPNGSRTSAMMDHFFQRYCDSLRDRLILSFELAGKTHKPKLVALTGCARGGGTSTLAAGLAAALAQAGEGKVLLVDMRGANAGRSTRFAGSPTVSLYEVLEGDQTLRLSASKLYLASIPSANHGQHDQVQIVPSRFYDLLPRFKASEFDYIIFDTPPVAESSATLAMAGYMDKVVLVVEAEKNSRSTVQRTYNELLSAKADIAVIFNKAHTYGPEWLQLE